MRRCHQLLLVVGVLSCMCSIISSFQPERRHRPVGHEQVFWIVMTVAPFVVLVRIKLPDLWNRQRFHNIRQVYEVEHNKPYTVRTECFKRNCGMEPRSMFVHATLMCVGGFAIAGLSFHKDIPGFLFFGLALGLWNFFIMIFACFCRHHLWILSLLQTVLFGLCALFAAIWNRPKDLLSSGYDSTLVLMLVTQLGNWRLAKTKAFTCSATFFLTLALFIAVLTMLSHSYSTGMVFGNPHIEFCLPDEVAAGTCTPVEFPLYGVRPRYEFCGMSWRMGRNTTPGHEGKKGTVSDKCHDTRLSIADFGQISTIAGYLPNISKVKLVLHYNLPGWTPVHQQIYNLSNGSFTTFIHLRRGSTDVVAVRGTSSAVEALQDLNLWMPVAFLQMARSMGPSLYSTKSVLQTLQHGSQDYRSESFSDLVKYMRDLNETFGHNHTIYMTGHSLGGGLATAVGAALHIPAITFSAPGLSSTSVILKPTPHEGYLVRDSVNVVPDKDVVPTVDAQTGTVLHTVCPLSNPFACHRLMVTMCEILASCGDGGGRPVPRGYQRSCETCSRVAGLHLEQCKAHHPHPDPDPSPAPNADPVVT